LTAYFPETTKTLEKGKQAFVAPCWIIDQLSFDRCIIASRVPRITVHGTRKTCASLLAALDVHPRVAMRILRHSKIAVTMEIYTEAPSDATRDALRKLGDWLT